MSDIDSFLKGNASGTGGTSKGGIEEFLGKAGATNESKTDGSLERAVAGVGDFFAGFAGQLVSLPVTAGAELMGAAMSPWTGESAKDVLRSGERIGSKVDVFSGAGTKAVHALTGRSEADLQKNVVQRGMNWVGEKVHEGSVWAEDKTGVPGEAFEQMFNTVMLKLPEMTVDAGKWATKSLLEKRRAAAAKDKSSVDEILKKEGVDDITKGTGVEFKTPPTDAELRSIKKDLDMHRNAEKTAYDLMQSGASGSAVAAAVKKNPLVKDKLDNIRQQRADAAQAFDRDFGARQGQIEPEIPEAGKGAIDKELSQDPRGIVKGLEDQAGKADPRLLAGIAAAGGLAAWAYQNPDRAKNIFHPEALVAAGIILPGTSLGVAIGKGKYTLKTFERLPQNRTEFPKTMIEEQLRREGVSQAEKDVIQNILSADKNDTISAKDLVDRFRVETGSHELVREKSQRYADYGLDNIDRATDLELFDDYWNRGDEAAPQVDPTKTSSNLYRLPEHMEIAGSNHFSDSRLFGWTRTFEENGVRHVVEIQSDLAQHAKGGVRSEDVPRLLEDWRKAEQEVAAWDKKFEEARQNSDGETVHALSRNPEYQAAILRLQELRNKYEATAVDSQLSPMLKNWPRRLIREELAHAKEAGEGSVRFATADTVAKVEGWPEPRLQTQARLADLQRQLRNAERGLTGPSGLSPEVTASRLKDLIANEESILKGLPEDVRFKPEHQSIYDRYAKDITKYLKSLGGKEVADSAGHTWIEVPLDKTPKGKVEMYGRADPKFLAALTAVFGGALIGWNLGGQEQLEKALLGAGVGLALAKAPRYIDALRDNWKSTIKTTAGVTAVTAGLTLLDKKHPAEGMLLGMLYGASKLLPKASIPKIGNMTIDDFVNLRNGAYRADQRRVDNVAYVIEKSIPDKMRREEIARKLDVGDLNGLTKEERQAVDLYKKFTQDFGEAAKDVGLIQDLITNYVTHVVQKKGLPMSRAEEVLRQLFSGQFGGDLGKSQFTKQRKYQTFDELQKALVNSGLEIKTMDLAEITRIYGQSMSRAIQNKRLINNLANAELAEGGKTPLVAEYEKAPVGYVTVNSPQLRGKAVHPDLAPSLRFVMEAHSPGEITRGLLAVSMATKRLATSLSFFHASNLINAYAGAMGTDVVRLKSSIDAAFEMYRKGGSGDAIDYGLRNGLEAVKPIEADVQALTKLGGVLDDLVERATGLKTGVGEKGLGALEKLQQETFDKVTWDYLHQGMKLAVFIDKFEKGLMKNPKMDPNEVARQTASFVNDTFGGLDWYRVATESQSQFGRKMALSAMSPQGRSWMQILMFAPDWTFSTFRAMYKGLPGATDMPLTAKMHQGYLLRTAAIYATLMNGYNIMASGDPGEGKNMFERAQNRWKTGHSIWENKDITKIEWNDGQRQQIAKHAMEGLEWLENPRQTLLNKLGFVPKEVMTQATGVEYLSAEGKSPNIESRTAHLLKGVAPITAQQMAVPGRSAVDTIKQAGLSIVGAPMYGLTKEEQAEAKRRKRAKKLAEKESK